MIKIETSELNQGKIVVINIKGAMDSLSLEQVSALVKKNIDRGKLYFIIDLSEVMYINSSNILDLLRCKEYIIIANGILKLCGLNQEIYKVLEYVGIVNLLEIEENFIKALKAIEEGR